MNTAGRPKIGQTRIRRQKANTVNRYEIVNLTGYGTAAGFPVSNAVVITNLRVTHRLSNGVSIEIPLFDLDGVRQIDLDSDGLLLRSEGFVFPTRSETVEVVIQGRIRSATIDIYDPDLRRTRRAKVYPEFVLETVLVAGLYEAIYVTDAQGRRYTIGTIGLISKFTGRQGLRSSRGPDEDSFAGNFPQVSRRRSGPFSRTAGHVFSFRPGSK